MAFVKRISIKTNLRNSIHYITDEKDLKDLSKQINYIVNENKISGISGYNVAGNPDVAYKQMMKLKERFNKKDGVLGYHYIQSFKPNETTPEQAHKIAEEFIKKTFPNCMVIYATHIDKNHIHNHFTVNSVQLDGKKFNSQTKTLYKARENSDEICKKYNLSIIEKKEFDPAIFEKRDEIIRNDINKSILKSSTYEEFKTLMIKSGYRITDNKYLSLKPKGYKKAARSKALGEIYSKETIIQRIEDKEFNNKMIAEFGLDKTALGISVLNQLKYKSKEQKDKEILRLSQKIEFINRYKSTNLDDEIFKLKEKLNSVENVIKNYEKQNNIIKNLIDDIKYFQVNKEDPLNYKDNRYNTVLSKLDKNNIDLNQLGKTVDGLEQKLFENKIKIEEINSNKDSLISDLSLSYEIKKDMEHER